MKKLLLSSFLLLFSALASAADLSVTAASVVPGARAQKEIGTAGATITAGQLLYYDSTAGTYKLADANASATTANVVGIAATGASSGQPIVVITADDDLTVGATLSMTAPVYCCSGTAGGIAPSADLTTGWYPGVVLVAKSTTKAVFKIVKGTAALSMISDLGYAPRLALLPPPHFRPFNVHCSMFSVQRSPRRRDEIALAA